MSTRAKPVLHCPWRRLRVVVNAGPTREHVDDIRFLSNGATGRLGMAIARRAHRLGADVTLVLGPTPLPAPTALRVVRIVSTEDLYRSMRDAVAQADIVILSAAPSDWKPVRRQRGKPARESGDWSLDLTPTRDVAAALGRTKKGRIHIGFALEVGGGVARAKEKMRKKRLDAIVLNGLRNMGQGGGDAWWIGAEGDPRPLSTASKTRLANSILNHTGKLWVERSHRSSSGR